MEKGDAGSGAEAGAGARAGARSSGPCRRVLLVGFMGSGKSTVGWLLASRLGWTFRDFDAEIERLAGASVEEIFRERGEAFFRRVEADVGEALLCEDGVVLASGGGWPVAAGRMETVPDGTLSVWLEVSAETSVARIREQGEARPLLAVADPVQEARRLIAERGPRYGRARLHLDTEKHAPPELVDIILSNIGEPAAAEPSGGQ